MALVEWNDNFSVGVPDIDHEHRQLIELINELYANLQADHETEDVLAFFGEIHAGISAHFALEERLMRESGYAEYQAHKEEHERLLDDIRDLMDEYAADKTLDEEDMSRRLQSWFSNHFKTMDARLHKQFG